MARRAIDEAGVAKTIYGISRFSDPASQDALASAGVRTVSCDLLDREAVAQLPKVANVIYMVGRKFGTRGAQALTWATNVSVPDNVSHHYRESRIVVFSTGCVYPLVPVSSGGCTEGTPPDPVGEYAQSCLGRERVFSYWSETWGTPVCFMRLNYAIDLRYGVLYDIGFRVFSGKPVDLTVSHFNAIWQGDANDWALRCLEACASPPSILNVTGPETVSVRFVAEAFARLFGVQATFTGDGSGGRMYLSNAAAAVERFGYPSVPLMTMIRWQAAWIQGGGRSLHKPTHFGVVDGDF
ncbi:MAG: NAD(P)-dependent oxidoreductase [Anaerolineae bacterium]|nr:NAD(P)-dependent oxidoreductase [Anaerolineae bacterium]